VKGINNNEKFDDIIYWIIYNNFDIIILIETKLKPILAIYNFKKFQKNYISHWTIDSKYAKRSSIAIITKKETIGKHIYRHYFVKGKVLTIYCRYKGEKTIIITDIYGLVFANNKAKLITKTITDYI
jgi:hypothetical protein